MSGITQRARDRLAQAVEYTHRAPGWVLTAILALHLLIWTVLPILVCPNLQLDPVEGLALGKEWQLGYWKHPPLPWWIADATYRATGQLDAVYLLGPLASIVCLYGVYLLAREVISPIKALVSVLVLEGIHFFNFSAVKFGHDQMQLPYWAFTGLYFHRALVRGDLLNWVLAGIFLGGAFWSKYAVAPLAAALGLFLLIDPTARQAWRTLGPWAMATAFVVVVMPHVWWLVHHDFLPLRYLDSRAPLATHWYQYFTYPLQWTGNQVFFLLPAIGLIAALYVGTKGALMLEAPLGRAAFDRRFITALGVGPFAITTLAAAMSGRFPLSMWGYPLWSFTPLAALMWLGPISYPARQERFAVAFLVVFFAFPLAYAGIEVIEPFIRDRPKATQFAGAAAAASITNMWHDRFAVPLVYVCGSEFDANTIAVYSPDRPHVVAHCDPQLSPWIDIEDVHRRGIAVVFDKLLVDEASLDHWRRTLGRFEVGPPLVLPRQTWHWVKPDQAFYGFMAPQP
jgi:4-amino-4-deoxy-L-arabinose transferase-like glycosyltransferase